MRHLIAILASLMCAPPALAAPLYVSCEDDGHIGVIDTVRERLVTTWLAGRRPRGLRIAPDGAYLYVALSGSPKDGPEAEAGAAPADRTADGIAVLELTSGRSIRVLTSGQDPETFDVSVDGRTLFVSNEETAQASIVDAATGLVRATVAVGGEPEGVRLRPDGKIVYVTSEADGVVSAIDTERREVVARIPAPERPRVVVFSSDGRRAYVSSENGARVTVVDAQRHRVVGTIHIGGGGARGRVRARPMGLALTADGKTLYVTNGRGGTVSVIDTARRRVLRTIADVGARPWGVALDAAERKLYTANGPSNDVSVIDLASGAIVKHIPTCHGPWGLALGRLNPSAIVPGH